MAKYAFDRNCKIEDTKYKIGDEVPTKGISAKDFQFLKDTGTIKAVGEEKVEKDLGKLNKALSAQLNKSEQENQVLTSEAEASEEEKKALVEKVTILEEENRTLLEENQELKKNNKEE